MSIKEELMEIIEAIKYTSEKPEEIVHGKGPRIIVKESRIIDVQGDEGIILEGKEEDGKIKAKIIVKKAINLNTQFTCALESLRKIYLKS